jgi:hypothetical protein
MSGMEVIEPANWKYKSAPTMLSSQSITQRKQVKKIIGQWPTALIVLGVALTIAWGGFLIWLLLRLLQIV